MIDDWAAVLVSMRPSASRVIREPLRFVRHPIPHLGRWSAWVLMGEDGPWFFVGYYLTRRAAVREVDHFVRFTNQWAA